jgi:hypothetical protein
VTWDFAGYRFGARSMLELAALVETVGVANAAAIAEAVGQAGPLMTR